MNGDDPLFPASAMLPVVNGYGQPGPVAFPSATPGLLPTPPVDYPLSKPGVAMQKYASELLPSWEQLRATRSALASDPIGTMMQLNPVSSLKNLYWKRHQEMAEAAKTPAYSQERWNATVGAGLDLLSLFRMLSGQGAYRGTTVPGSYGIHAVEDLGPSVAPMKQYWPRVPPSYGDYYGTYMGNISKQDLWGAYNTLRNAEQFGYSLPPRPYQNLYLDMWSQPR